jgi:hypothetical protein
MNFSLKEIRIPMALIGLMLATRFHHFGDSLSLPDASLAAFFFAGLWVKGWKFFALLIIQAGLIDYVAISQFSVSDYCISPAYAFLIPTYACLWAAGKYCARYKTIELSKLTSQFGILFIATTVAFAISNGSFYLLSGKFSNLSWVEYTARVAQYYPTYLAYTLVYVAVIFLVVTIINLLFSTSVKPAVNHSD